MTDVAAAVVDLVRVDQVEMALEVVASKMFAYGYVLGGVSVFVALFIERAWFGRKAE
jgi:hypothetical protein